MTPAVRAPVGDAPRRVHRTMRRATTRIARTRAHVRSSPWRWAARRFRRQRAGVPAQTGPRAVALIERSELAAIDL